LADGLEAAKKIGFPLVVKPEDSAYGLGVTVGVNSEEELSSAYDHAYSINKSDVIIQSFVKGEDFRIMVVDYKVCAIAKRVPCKVSGNGKYSISKLIEEENKNPMRGKGKVSPMTNIEIDKDMMTYLEEQGLSLEYIPQDKEVIFLRKIANLSQGGEAENVTDICSEKNKKLFEDIARVLQASVVGIDILCEDITKDLSNNDYAVIEVNASPGIRMHHFPSKGTPINVARCIIEALFPELKK
jgi:cyanophycin synthetase